MTGALRGHLPAVGEQGNSARVKSAPDESHRTRNRRARLRPLFRTAAAVAVLSLALPSLALAQCATTAERTALAARVLQSELMVAALSCKQQPAYNAFVVKFKDELVASGHTLRAFFTRTHGRSGNRELNAFITQMANEASFRSLREGAFCESAPQRFDEALSAEIGQFKQLLARFPGRDAHGIPACHADAGQTGANASQQEAHLHTNR